MRIVILIMLFWLGVFLGMSARDQANGADVIEKPRSGADITLTTLNTVVFRDIVTSESISKLIGDIERSIDPSVYLYISSAGGSVSAGMSFITYLQATDKKVTCIADYAASMAFAIFQACTERVVLPHSILMQHEASLGLNQGEMPNQKSLLGLIEAQLEEMDQMQADRIGISMERFKELYTNDWWVFGKANVKANVADRSAKVLCSKILLDTEVNETVRTMFGPVDVTYSGCPLLDYPVRIESGRSYVSPKDLTPEAIKKINRIQ